MYVNLKRHVSLVAEQLRIVINFVQTESYELDYDYTLEICVIGLCLHGHTCMH